MRKLVIVGCIAATSAPAPALAATVGVGASRDNTLFQSPTGALSNGAGPHLFVGVSGTENVRRGVIAFDLAPVVPRYSLIHAGTLTLVGSRTSSKATVIDVHRLTADWGEGTSNSGSPGGGGAPSTPGDATWIHRFYDQTPWTTEGGDFAPDPSVSLSVGGLGADSWPSTAAMVADVQAWIDNPVTNFGWLLKAADETVAGNAKRFDTREIEAPANRPSLTIDFIVAGDANADDRVNLADFNALAANFGLSGGAGWEQGDFNRDGSVNLIDFNILASNFGTDLTGGAGATVGPPPLPASLVPEPGFCSTSFLACLTLARRRRITR